MISCDYIIIGAGFAGAATAYHLACRGVTDVILLEQEAVAGFHSSGRNAAMIRQCVSDPALVRLTRDGAAFLRQQPSDWPSPVPFKRSGSLLLGSGEGWEKLKCDAEHGRSLGIEVVLWSPEQAKSHVPVLRGAEFDGAIWCPTDGVIDVHALLSGYLKVAVGRGARIRYGCQVRSIRATGDNGLEILTQDERLHARIVINAAGAWANTIGEMVGALRLPLRPCRRHLFVSPPLAWVSSGWPFVWDVSHDIYFRPEGGGLLLCACDQEEMAPGDPPVDAAVRELLAEKIQSYIPGLAEVSINKSWAGFRTLSSDGRFIIGWDPIVKGLFWVAGLGGHGVTTSASVGALAT
ncbi:MAG TPA: FAD-dependent oxidoreductase, partial [Candidatus Binatia bacterium]|nr:FAD-dependent oxidoreductase [Candidatus Binatia bacterium]